MYKELFLKIYGLTGSSGSGKSTAVEELNRLGGFVVSLDALSRAASKPGGKAYPKILETFGEDFLNNDRSLNSRKLHDLVFSKPNELKKLESIIHPMVRDEAIKLILEEQEKDKNRLIFYESPLLFEKNLDRELKFKKTIYISIPDDLAIKRITSRDNITEEQATLRLKNQLPDSEKKARADIVIDNSGSREEFKGKINTLFNELQLAD